MAYTPTTWVNDVTAINATRMNHLETGVDDVDQALADHLADTTDAHDASAISVADSGANFAASNVEDVLAELQDNIDGVGGFTSPELSYVQFTSSVAITATTEATADTVVTAGAVSVDGSTPIIIEFYSPGCDANIAIVIYDGSSTIGGVCAFTQTAAAFMNVRKRITPSNGSHTYSVRAYKSSGTPSVTAGAGGSGNNMPGFIRITRA